MIWNKKCLIELLTTNYCWINMKDRFIENLYWVFTHKCNNTCAHCYNEAGPQEIVPKTSEIDKIFENIAMYRFRRINLSGGEPFYSDNKDILFYIIKKIKKWRKIKCVHCCWIMLYKPKTDWLSKFRCLRCGKFFNVNWSTRFARAN